MAHSNQIREFVLTGEGIELVDAYLGTTGVLTGSARIAQEVQEQAAERARRQEIESHRLELERKHKALEAQIAALQAEIASTEAETARLKEEQHILVEHGERSREAMARSRQVRSTGLPSSMGYPVEQRQDKEGSNV